MPSITTKIDQSVGLTVHTLEGRINAVDIIGTIDEYYRGHPTPFIVWDFTEALLGHYQETNLRSIIHAAKKYAVNRPGGKTALVLPGDLQFGTGRVFETYAELEKLPILVQSFRSLSEALAWLGV